MKEREVGGRVPKDNRKPMKVEVRARRGIIDDEPVGVRGENEMRN